MRFGESAGARLGEMLVLNERESLLSKVPMASLVCAAAARERTASGEGSGGRDVRGLLLRKETAQRRRRRNMDWRPPGGDQDSSQVSRLVSIRRTRKKILAAFLAHAVMAVGTDSANCRRP